MKIILASKSPRRKELLAVLGHDICVIPARVCEKNTNYASIKNFELALYNSELKAQYVCSNYGHVGADIILAADTIINFNKKLMGKPKDKEHAKNMLRELSGLSHEVITAYYLIHSNKKYRQNYVTSQVKFRELSNQEILSYVNLGESLDKAGGYGIQGAGAALISNIQGSVTNIIGLPVEEIMRDIDELLCDS